MGPAGYKRYRIYLNTAAGGYIVATSNTVNDLVGLTKQWLEQTSAGYYMPEETSGTIVLQQLDKKTGAYVAEERIPFRDKTEIIGNLRKLGGR